MILLLLSCFPDLTPGEGITDSPFHDYDGDGYSAFDADCDDTRAEVFPGAVELPDGLDNDCDELVDEGLDTGDTGPGDDRDGDGYPADQDCNDDIASIHPGAEEVPGNSIDEDCDGRVCGAAVAPLGEVLLSDSLTVGVGSAGPFVFDVGDLDGDGQLELVVGVLSDEAVYLVSDPSLGLEGAHRIAGGPKTGFGVDLAVGDLDGDGVDELMVLARNEGLGGELRVFSDPWLATEAADGVAVEVDSAVALHDWMLLADLSGDGQPELVLTTDDGGAGAVLVLGASSLLQGGLAADLAGAVVYAGAGETVHYLASGDVNGDGVDELIVGGVSQGDPAAWVFREPPASGNLDLSATLVVGHGAYPVADGDLDGDGAMDLALSIDTDGENAGRVHVLSGATLHGEVQVLVSIDGESGQRLGRDLTMAWDADGAATPTLLVAGRTQDRTFLFQRPSGELVSADADAVLVGEGQAGFTLLVLPDLDQDCVAELVVGPHAPGESFWIVSGTTP